ncbi:MAG: transposase [Solirubrobacteraceae bacterium]
MSGGYTYPRPPTGNHRGLEAAALWNGFPHGLAPRAPRAARCARDGLADAPRLLDCAASGHGSSPWQRCRVHFLRDCLGHARKDQHGVLAALIRPIFNATSRDEARDRLSAAVAQLEGRVSKVASLLEEAEEDILAFYAFPADHWRKLRSTNPLERFNREIGRRTDVVGIFPDDPSLIRLATMLAIEQNDEWLVGRRYLSAGSMEPLLEERPHRHDTKEEVPELQAA